MLFRGLFQGQLLADEVTTGGASPGFVEPECWQKLPWWAQLAILVLKEVGGGVSQRRASGQVKGAIFDQSLTRFSRWPLGNKIRPWLLVHAEGALLS